MDGAKGPPPRVVSTVASTPTASTCQLAALGPDRTAAHTSAGIGRKATGSSCPGAKTATVTASTTTHWATLSARWARSRLARLARRRTRASGAISRIAAAWARVTTSASVQFATAKAPARAGLRPPTRLAAAPASATQQTSSSRLSMRDRSIHATAIPDAGHHAAVATPSGRSSTAAMLSRKITRLAPTASAGRQRLAG